MDQSAFTKRGKPRQRAGVACIHCQSKRVKCSVGVSGPPCLKCRDEHRECRLATSRRSSEWKGRSASRTVDRASTDYVEPPPFQPEETPSSYTWPATTQIAAGSQSFSEDVLDDSDSGPVINDERNTLYAQMLDGADPSDQAGPSRHAVPGHGQVMYFGETFNLTHLLSHRKSHATHRSIMPSPFRASRRSQPRCISELSMDILHRQGAFILPPSDGIRDLFKVFFRSFYPHYPILDRQHIATLYGHFDFLSSPPASYLLLQCILFTAVGHCDDALIKRAGFQDRYQARSELFKRSKALYDADHETDKVILVQSLFLMSFWWDHPTDQKDTWHWLGNAISLAVTMGMHRSTKGSVLSPKDQSLWRRIWWSLYVEDKHASAALGRPSHIHVNVCDVEMLELSDFQEESLSDDAQITFGTYEEEHGLYVFHLCSLSKIVEEIINVASGLGVPSDGFQTRLIALKECHQSLASWKSRLPPQLSDSSKFWPSMLLAAYSWFRILTYRLTGFASSNAGSAEPAIKDLRDGAVQATDLITRVVEQTLSSGDIHKCPIHIVPTCFAAMGMNAIDLWDSSGDELKGQLGYVKIRLCMIALRELQTVWPVAGWIFLLFTRIVGKIRDRDREYMALPKDTDLGHQPREDGIQHEARQAVVDDTGLNLDLRLDDSTLFGSDFLSIPFDFPQDWLDIIDPSGPSIPE